VPSVPALKPGTRVVLDLSQIDLLELTFHAEFATLLSPVDEQRQTEGFPQ
jgi:hypothetical protein